MFRTLSLAVLGATMSVIMPVPAKAQSVSMSCAQAVATYERSGRITVRSRSGTTLPFYDGVPVSRRSSQRCSQAPVSVAASDNPRCIIAYRCVPQAHGGR